MARNASQQYDGTNTSITDDANHALRVNVVAGGAGGGAVTVADGADVTQGAIADAAVVGDNPGTVNAHLRGIDKTLSAGIMANAGTNLNTSALALEAGGHLASLDSNAGTTADAAVSTDATGTLSGKIRGIVKLLAAALSVVGPTASGSALTASPQTIGGLAKTALPTAVADAQVVNAMLDKYGRQVVLLQAPRDLAGTQTTTISASTSETTIATAVASTFLDLVAIFVANTSATAVRVDFRDTTGGTIIFSVYAPASATTGFMPPIPVPQTTVNTNWTAQSSASVTDLRVFVEFVKNK